MEVLAPAGSPEGLVAAIKGGCDAVYLAGKSFGARAFAGNFTDSELEGAVKYAHEHGVKVNVTVNTLIKNGEMSEAVSFVQYLKDIGADAVIIQDVGLLKEIRNIQIAKHASTQMGIYTKEGLKWCAENGITRAILSRELTFDEIKELAKDSPVELEVFVQGAMCYCFSGGCLFSSIVGGRSGNRGKCAQPCRKKYSVSGKEGYFLSNADMYCLDYLDKLREIGIASVKIEGRMRSEAYAYLSSKSYSLANKGEKGDELDSSVKLLKTVFNRGFCHGYLDGVSSLVQSTYPDNRGMFLGKTTVSKNKLSVGGLEIHKNDGISVYSGDEKIGGFKVTRPSGEILSPFRIDDGTYDLYRTYDPRLDVVKNMIGKPPKLEGNTKMPKKSVHFSDSARKKRKADLSFYVSSIKVLEKIIDFADRIYYDGNEIAKAKEICDSKGKEFVFYMPRFSVNDDVPEGDFPVMVHGLGQYRKCKSLGRKIYGSYLSNMFNSFYPVDHFQTTISVELNKHEIKEILSTSSRKIEVMVFGRIELMVTRDPKLGAGTLVDEKGFSFPFYKDVYGMSHILNSSDLMLLNYVDDLERAGADSLGIDLRKRPVELAELVAKAFFEKTQSFTDEIKELCGGTLNTGHYSRGV